MRSKWAITLIICITLCLRISKTYTVASKSMPILQYSQIRVKLQNKLLHTNKTSNFSVSIINNSSTTTSSDKSSLSGTNQSLNQIFTSTLAYSENPTTFTIYNYQSTIKNLTISLQSTTNVSVPEYVILLSQSKQESTFLAIIDDIVTSGYMLPFNMLNIKESNIIVIQHDSSLVQKSYNLPPFANTYWTENSITATMMPWLPYFSKCTFQKKYILLNDILKPGFCRTDDQQIVVCSPKTFQFDCIVEQFQVKNATSEYWFNQKQAILFYLYPTKMDYLELDALKNNKDNLTTLITNFHSSLIPVLYRRQSADQVIVNSFQININILLTLKQDAVITYAEIIGDYDADIKSPNGKVYVNVSYDFFESFLLYGFSIQWYILYCFIFLGVIFMILFCLAKKFNMKNLSKKVKLIVAPAIKGVALSLITAGNFIILMHLISNYSNFSGIIATFDSNQSGQTLQYNNMGRYGLTIFITGLYILTSGIKQTFKVNEQQELKIAFEDDKTKFQNEQQLKTKIEFSRDNLFSYRKYLFNGSIVNLLTTILIFFICSNLTNFQMAMVQLFVIPVLGNAYIAFQNDFLFRNNLFGCSTLASAAVLFHFFILGNQCIQEMTYLYICYFLSHMVFMPLYSILISWLLLKLEANKQSTKIAEILCSISIIQKKIQILKCQSQYQQALYYSNFNVSVLIKIFLLPFCLIFIYLTQNQNQISKIFFVKDYSILVTFVVCILGMIVQTYTVLFIVQFLKKQFGIRVQQVMKYNSFRFTRTKFRWMNDVFAESKYIREEFRQYEKFAFSSQLYFVISLNTIGLQTMFLGAMIMLYIQYLPFYDPATVVIFVTVWILGQVLSIIVSVVGIRLKLYEKKGNESIKQKLAKMDKYLKPDDKKQYLQLDGVKDFFLISNKEWIINNLHKIFTKEDLKARNYELINKYKEYKRNFKRKQIDQKKQQNQLKLMSNTIQCRPSISEQPYLVVKNKRVFTVTKPIALYWHCMAKQNLYLKNIVVCVKKQKIKTVCEYCNMDIYLQAVQKYDFHDIVNSYRVQNVGKMFDQQAFLQYYRINQQYVTICLECKQKNMHLHTKIEKKSVAYKLMFCWLMTARSNILHKRNTVND